MPSPKKDKPLTSGAVADMFGVQPRTVVRWAAAGRITCTRTPGGHRRYFEDEIRALLRGDEGSPR